MPLLIRLFDYSSKLLCSISPRYLIPISFATPFCSCSSLSLILKSALPRFLQSLRFLNRKRNSTSLLCYPLCFPSPILKSTLPHSVADLPPRRFEFCFCFSLRRYSFPILLWPCWCSVSLSLSGNLLSPLCLCRSLISFNSSLPSSLLHPSVFLTGDGSPDQLSLFDFLFSPPVSTVRLSRSPIAQLLHCFLHPSPPSMLSLICFASYSDCSLISFTYRSTTPLLSLSASPIAPFDDLLRRRYSISCSPLLSQLFAYLVHLSLNYSTAFSVCLPHRPFR